MVKPHMAVQQERFDGKWKDLDRLPLRSAADWIGASGATITDQQPKWLPSTM